MTPLAPDTLRGLPGPLPAGEQALWQGSPRWTTLIRRTLHAPVIALYFAALVLWAAAEGAAAGQPAREIAGSVLWIASLGAAVLALIAVYAWFAARTTVYTITTRRLILTFGIALPVTLNLPFKAIGAAAVRLFADGAGDIPVTVTEKRRLSYIVLWPHARPWRLGRVEPMLRAVPDARDVAEILAAALAEAQGVRPVAVTEAKPREAKPREALAAEPRAVNDRASSGLRSAAA